MKVGDKTLEVKPFWIATTETPWEAYDVFLTSGPPSPAYDQTKFAPDAIARPSKSYILPDLGWGHHGFPAINLSITSVTMYCRWLSKATGKKYRLPTEAEWQWACQEGEGADWKIDKTTLDKSAWDAANSSHLTHPIGKKLPNKYGLYDMLGNVGEWAMDPDDKPVLCEARSEMARWNGPDHPPVLDAKVARDRPSMPKSRWCCRTLRSPGSDWFANRTSAATRSGRHVGMMSSRRMFNSSDVQGYSIGRSSTCWALFELRLPLRLPAALSEGSPATILLNGRDLLGVRFGRALLRSGSAFSTALPTPF